MYISTTAFEQTGPIPAKYTCDGADISPKLSIEGVPEGAKSLVLIMDDPDAPGETWVHWVVWNISPDTREIPEGTVPAKAIEGVTSFGKHGYGGPCPHKGTHRYFFKLYALDTVLNVPLTSEPVDIEKAIEGHILADTHLMGVYTRNSH